MERDKIPLARLYRRLFSRFWPERLKAYDTIAEELTRRGCNLFKIKQLMPFEMDAKLLTGQMVSIYMKRLPQMKLSEFATHLERVYDFLLKPVREEHSAGHMAMKEMLLAIYDDDDSVARKQVGKYFKTELRPDLSVIENIFLCYGRTMWEVRERAGAFLEPSESKEKLA